MRLIYLGLFGLFIAFGIASEVRAAPIVTVRCWLGEQGFIYQEVQVVERKGVNNYLLYAKTAQVESDGRSSELPKALVPVESCLVTAN